MKKENTEAWKECKLGDLVTLNYGKALKEENRLEGSVPVFSSAGITGWHAKALVESEGIIIGRKGTIGKVYKTNIPFFCIDTAYYILPNDNVFNFNYLYYCLQTLGLEDLNSDSAVPGLNRDAAYCQDILLPPLPEQKAIAAVLSRLDDKIDLLHRQNKTLEAMAETLFRQWFVEEADEGWEEGKILDYCLHHKDGVKPQNQPNEIFSHYSIPAFDNSLNPVIECGSEIQSNKYSVVQNSFLFSKLNPNKVKRIWLILDDLNENAICSTEFQVVRPKDKKYLFFTYLWLSIPQNYDEIASGVGGTSGSHQRIDPADIFNFACPLIGDDLLISLNSKVAPIFMKVMENRVQIRTLEKLRDTLLPKLMSGEVRVKV